MVSLFAVKLTVKFVKENIMPVLKLFGKRIGGPKEEDMSKRISPDDTIGPNLREPSRMARQDFSEMTSKGPNMGKVNKVTKKEVSVEGNLGSVDKSNPDVIGPNMSQVNKPDAVAATPDLDAMQQAQNMLQPKPFGYKKGGKVKAKPVKRMASGGKASQLAKANGIAIRGKSRGRII